MSIRKMDQQKAAYSFGLLFVIFLIAIAFVVRDPSPFQYIVFRVILALAAAGVAAMIPGFLNVQVANTISFALIVSWCRSKSKASPVRKSAAKNEMLRR